MYLEYLMVKVLQRMAAVSHGAKKIDKLGSPPVAGSG